MDDDEIAILKKIVTIHCVVKKLTIRAEEFDGEQEIFFPPVIQQRDAYDHFVRLEAAVLGLKQFPDQAACQKYQSENLDKALGHEYRAFFDVADWLAILYREKMHSLAGNYSAECIDGVLPIYYSEIVPFLEKLHRGITEIREKKDIATADDLLEEVAEYHRLLDKLDEYWGKIVDAESALRLRKTALVRSKLKAYLVKLAIALVAACVGAGLGYALRGR